MSNSPPMAWMLCGHLALLTAAEKGGQETQEGMTLPRSMRPVRGEGNWVLLQESNSGRQGGRRQVAQDLRRGSRGRGRAGGGQGVKEERAATSTGAPSAGDPGQHGQWWGQQGQWKPNQSGSNVWAAGCGGNPRLLSQGVSLGRKRRGRRTECV